FGWRFGISATWIGLANALLGSALAWIVLGRRTRIMTTHLGSATMPAFFGSRFDSQKLKIGASLIVFIFLIPYTASLYNGLSRLFEMAFGLDFVLCIVIISVLTGVYVVAGGYFAQAVNDFIQGIIMLFGIIAVIVVVLGNNGGFMGAITSLASPALADETISNGTVSGIFSSFFGPDPFSLFGVMILTSLGTWGLPQLVSRFYSIKSENMIKKGTVISTLFATVVAGGCYFLGGFGRLYSDVIEYRPNGSPIFDSIIPKMLEGLPVILIGIVLVLVFAASMSTLSSLVIASSSTLTLDCLKGHIVKKMSEKTQLIVIRLLIVVFIIISAAIATFQYSSGGSVIWIAQLMGISWGALAGAFLAPFLYGLFWKRATKAAVWVNFVFSTVFMVANVVFNIFFNDIYLTYFPKVFTSPTGLINAGAFVMLAGLIIVPLVSYITKAPDKKMVEHCFAGYEQPVTTKLSTSLGE
ncbi:MAG: sodium:solute symporter, partial [Oscillospiraceae bacterium]|nr:sodium:solute symporter [Oscillospiraceae bacterium]